MSTIHTNFSTIEKELLELLADEALGELSEADAPNLDRLDANDRLSMREALEAAASAISVACAETYTMHALPLKVAASLSEQGREFARNVKPSLRALEVKDPRFSQAPLSLGLAATTSKGTSSSSSLIIRVLPWALAAAACFGVVVSIWPASNPTAKQQYAKLIETASDIRSADWADWELNGKPPEVAGVVGQIFWSDQRQSGVMRFDGLPKCINGSRYQLWIVDAERGFEQRISGGIFDGAPGELLVPFTPEIPVRKAQAFAITIEAPDGTWVSDMSRRVVIAMVK